MSEPSSPPFSKVIVIAIGAEAATKHCPNIDTDRGAALRRSAQLDLTKPLWRISIVISGISCMSCCWRSSFGSTEEGMTKRRNLRKYLRLGYFPLRWEGKDKMLPYIYTLCKFRPLAPQRGYNDRSAVIRGS